MQLLQFFNDHPARAWSDLSWKVINLRPDFVNKYSGSMADIHIPCNHSGQPEEVSAPATLLLAGHDELFDVSLVHEFSGAASMRM
ncbi:hypothetical protein IBT47_24910 [Erwinia sp. S43]|uniref:hypothetical protein n=1 Tax=Erwinia sp. S43 TaxID=2769339 RepID=UPI00190B3EB3|nr:hypothetical protein [Erwinia sp. S43]MBK0035523.1 hypothetical protein [Erwinia sp. S43]